MPRQIALPHSTQSTAGILGPRKRSRVRDCWGVVASILVHGAVFAALVWSPDAPPPSMASTIEMSMPIPAIEEAEAADATDVVTSAVKPPDVVQPLATEAVQVAKAVPEVIQEIQPEAVTPVEAVEAEPELEVVETRAVEAPVAVPRPPRPRPVQQAAVPVPETKPEPSPTPPPAPQAAPVPPSPAPVATHVATAASSAAMGPPPDYLTKLRAWLEKHKRYPRQAQWRRQQGTALLRFTLARDGRVLAHSIERSSGYATLDGAVEDMIERAAPLPPLPSDMDQDKLEIIVPIAFHLR